MEDAGRPKREDVQEGSSRNIRKSSVVVSLTALMKKKEAFAAVG
jgi:hypothetical protein